MNSAGTHVTTIKHTKDAGNRGYNGGIAPLSFHKKGNGAEL